jgi:hypothetical protein
MPDIFQYLDFCDNRCPSTCPICNQRCVGINNHLEETRQYQTPETEYHGCGTHRWIEPAPGVKLRAEQHIFTVGELPPVPKSEKDEEEEEPIRSIILDPKINL